MYSVVVRYQGNDPDVDQRLTVIVGRPPDEAGCFARRPDFRRREWFFEAHCHAQSAYAMLEAVRAAVQHLAHEPKQSWATMLVTLETPRRRRSER